MSNKYAEHILNTGDMDSLFARFANLMLTCYRFGFPADAVVKNLPAHAEDSRNEGSVPGRDSSKEMATSSSISV